MPRSTRPQTAQEVSRAEHERITANDLEEKTVDDEYTTVFHKTGTRTKRYAIGYGRGSGQSDIDFKNGANEELDLDVRYVVYESEDMEIPKAIYNTHNSDVLRASYNESLSDKRTIHGRMPRVGKDRVLALEVRATSEASVGETISQAESETEQGLPYSQFRV